MLNKLEATCTKLHTAYNRRNVFVHGLWASAGGEPTKRSLIRTSAAGTWKAQHETVEAADILAVALNFNEMTEELYRIREEHFASQRRSSRT